MANEKMTGLNPAPVDAIAWTDFIDQFEQLKVGGIGVSLSEWETANTDEPEITAGSFIELSGGLYQFAALTPIVDDPGGLIAGTIYVRFEPSGDDANPRFVNEAPVWNLTKQGWYDATEVFRYSGHLMEWDGATAYSEKAFFFKPESDGSVIKHTPAGVLVPSAGVKTDNIAVKIKYVSGTLTGAGTKTFAHGLSNAVIRTIVCSSYNSVTATWQQYTGYGDGGTFFFVAHNDTNIVVDTAGMTNNYGQAIRFIITYEA